MEPVEEGRRAGSRPAIKAMAAAAPLWLVSIAIMAEGFPRPPITVEAAIGALVIAGAASILLLWKKWMKVELVLYSLFPFLLLPIFDEISTRYKTPFILLCALILTVGVVIYQSSRASRLGRGLILLVFAGLAYVMAWYATANYWEMVSGLGFGQCFPDASDCAAFTGEETPWWALFFGL